MAPTGLALGLLLCAAHGRGQAAPEASSPGAGARVGSPEEPAAPLAAAEETVEEEAVFEDEGGGAGTTGADGEEEVVFGDEPTRAGPNAGFPEHETMPWLLLLPVLGLALIAAQVRWRRRSEEKS